MFFGDAVQATVCAAAYMRLRERRLVLDRLTRAAA
jgi:hypothetical protein